MCVDCRSKPKVCSYLERTFVTREKNRPDVRKLKTQEVWAGVTESFAVTMMRYHTKQQALLKPFIRASEPAMTAATPWANMLWLGLAAPPNVLHMVRAAAQLPGSIHRLGCAMYWCSAVRCPSQGLPQTA